MHTHASTDSDASGDVSCAAQAVQASEPIAFLYVPAAHAEQGPPKGPEYPTLHVQSDMSSLASKLYELVAHEEHDSLPTESL